MTVSELIKKLQEIEEINPNAIVLDGGWCSIAGLKFFTMEDIDDNDIVKDFVELLV